MTVALGLTFLSLQAHEYHEAYNRLGLTLGAGVYGATFFMLTGFHGFHVTVGTMMLIVVLFRSMTGHFTPEHHFAFEGGVLVLALCRRGLAGAVHLRLLVDLNAAQAGKMAACAAIFFHGRTLSVL